MRFIILNILLFFFFIAQGQNIKTKIKPLFDYQTCGLNTIGRREFTITVYQYDSLGKIKNEYPRKEIADADLYLLSTSKELTYVTTFPFFSSKDIKEINGGKISIKSKQEYINHYLKDVVVFQSSNSAYIEKIEAKLIIHGYTIKGHTIHEELYRADFEKVGECYLPKIIKFCPIDDVNYQKPRIIIKIEYQLK